MAIALERNPDLMAATQSWPVSRAALEVAKRYPYAPTAQVQMAPSPREADGGTLKTLTQVTLSQTFELGGQRHHRWRSGVAQLDRTEWLIRQAAVSTVAETQRRFFTALYQRHLLDVRQSMAELNEKLLGVLQRRFEAGQASAADVALARIEARSTAQQAAVVQTKSVAALQNLRTQLGLDSDQRLGLDHGVDEVELLPPQVLELLAEQTSPELDDADAVDRSRGSATFAELGAARPDVLAVKADLRWAQSQLNLARASLVPSVQLGPYFERDEGNTQFWGLVTQMKLGNAHTSNGTALVRQRQAEVRQRRVLLDQFAWKARLEIAAAARRYQQARRVVEPMGDDVAEQLLREVRRVQDLYAAGQVDLVRVFAARQAFLQFRTSRAEALNQLGQSAADLTAATGMLPAVLVTGELLD